MFSINHDIQTYQQIEFFNRLLESKIFNTTTLKLDKTPRLLIRSGFGSIRNVFHCLFGDGRLIIKFVRANGVVGYLYEYCDIPKPVIIIRHPCAVVASQYRQGWTNHPQVDENILKIYPEIENVIKNAKTVEEKMAITWSTDVLAAKLIEKNVQIIYYEDLVLNGETVLNKVFSEWGYKKVPVSCLEKLDEQSSTSREWSETRNGIDKVKSWSKYLTDDQVKRIFAVTKAMGVDDYDENSYLPKYSELNGSVENR